MSKTLYILVALFADGDSYTLRGPRTLEHCVAAYIMERQAYEEVLAAYPEIPIMKLSCIEFKE